MLVGCLVAVLIQKNLCFKYINITIKPPEFDVCRKFKLPKNAHLPLSVKCVAEICLRYLYLDMFYRIEGCFDENWVCQGRKGIYEKSNLCRSKWIASDPFDWFFSKAQIRGKVFIGICFYPEIQRSCSRGSVVTCFLSLLSSTVAWALGEMKLRYSRRPKTYGIPNEECCCHQVIILLLALNWHEAVGCYTLRVQSL